MIVGRAPRRLGAVDACCLDETAALRLRMFCSARLASFAKANAMWQWWNYCTEGRDVLRINLDETSVCVFQGGMRGTIFAPKARRRSSLRQHATRNERRSYLTHVAVICDRPEIQPLLPQIVIGNAATLRVRDMERLRGLCPPNVILVRQKSAWNNEVLCAKIIRRIGLAVANVGLQPVLIMDAVKLHLAARVFRACATARLWPIVVPPKMTSVLQPLDTHAFMPYKRALREAYQDIMAPARRGAVAGADAAVACVCAAVSGVLEGRAWARAFDETGFGDMQRKLGARLLKELDIANVSSVAVALKSRPPPDVLIECFPRRTRVQFHLVWMAFDCASAPLEALEVVGVRAEQSSASRDADGVARCRTRSATYGASFAWAALASRTRKRSTSTPLSILWFARVLCVRLKATVLSRVLDVI